MQLHNSITDKRLINSFNKLQNRCLSIHGNQYDYSKVVFLNMNTKVTIVCLKCNNRFLQEFSSHLRGRGCPECGKTKNSTSSNLQTFIYKANKIHNNYYDYTNSIYINSKVKLTIECPKHGNFYQIPNSHLLGNGCTKCANENSERSLKYSINDIILRAQNVHGKLYDYSNSVYTGIVNPIEINCKLHGKFNQVVSDHLKGRGCPSCATSGFKTALPAILYYLKIQHDNKTLYKVGITNNSIEERFTAKDRELITVLHQVHYKSGQDAYNEEQRILKQFKEFKYTGPDVLSSGNTELFTDNVFSK